MCSSGDDLVQLGGESTNLTLACYWRSCVDANYQVNYFEYEWLQRTHAIL